MDETATPNACLPMAELHCHLEGTVAPSMAMKLGGRHGIDLSGLIGDDGHYRWSSFGEFLKAYDGLCTAIRTADDYYDITYDYYSRMGKQGLIYGEVFVSPQHAFDHGISYASLIDAVSSALRRAEEETGVIVRIILTCVRHFGVDHAEKTAELAQKHPHDYVTGFGMGGDEAYRNAADFARTYQIAADAGLRLTAHAGEVAGAHSVRDAVEHLGVERVGHGVRASEDEAVVGLLAERNIVLEVCPGSNVALSVYPSFAEHPIRKLYEAGLILTLSSDDPPFFHTDIAQEYANASSVFDFSDDELLAFTRNSVSAAFCDRDVRDRLYERIREYAEHSSHLLPE